MKIFVAGALCLLLNTAFVSAQSAQSAGRQSASSPNAAFTAPGKVDPAKEADVRRLLDITGSTNLMLQTMDAMEVNMRPLMARGLPPGEYRDKLIELFFERFHAKRDPQVLVDLAVPLYDKCYSDDEIKGLIQFYQTPLGRKMITVLPKLTGELASAGQTWGQGLGRECMIEVLSEHPELAKAMEEARTQPLPK